MAKGLTQQQRNFVLVAAILASSMAFIDSTALNVALPALQRNLNLSGTQMIWVVNAYTLMLASFTLMGGALGDIYGKRKVFMLGIASFTVFSGLCGFSQSGLMLIIFRVLQGLGAALMVPGSLSIITASFQREHRGRAIGSWSMFSSFTTVLGPVLGGYLAGEGLWRAIFFINIPLGIASFLMLWLKIDEPAATKDRKLDWQGSLLSAASFGAITYAFIQASENGFSKISVWLGLGLGLIFLGAFLWREKFASRPMMPLSLFRSPTFSGANTLTLFVYGALTTVLFFLPLNLIQIQGYPENIAGLAILPFGGTIAIMARISGNWTDKVGAKVPLIFGPLITAAGFFLLTQSGMTEGPSDYWSSFFPGLLTAGMGMGLTVVPLTTAVMNCVDDDSAGIASGVNNTVSRLAGVLVLAVVGSIVLLNFKNALITNLSNAGIEADKLETMKAEASKLAEAAAPESWSQELKFLVEQSVNNNFIDAFNLSAYTGMSMCILGAVISFLFIKGKPKTVKLN